MPGFDTNRIVSLDNRFADTIQCPICLSILDNPLMTNCGHNYCQQCLKQVIQSGVKQCPKCRNPLTKKRPNESSDRSCVIIRSNRAFFVFSKNLSLKEVIGKLKISCDFELNGCKESVELESLSEHITQCVYRFCKMCGFKPKGETDDHNCIDVLKSESNDLKVKYEKSLDANKELAQNLDKLKAQIYSMNKLHSNSIKVLKDRIMEETDQKNNWKQKFENQTKIIILKKVSPIKTN